LVKGEVLIPNSTSLVSRRRSLNPTRPKGLKEMNFGSRPLSCSRGRVGTKKHDSAKNGSTKKSCKSGAGNERHTSKAPQEEREDMVCAYEWSFLV